MTTAHTHGETMRTLTLTREQAAALRALLIEAKHGVPKVGAVMAPRLAAQRRAEADLLYPLADRLRS